MESLITICGPRTAGKSTLRKQIIFNNPHYIHAPFAFFFKRMIGRFLEDQGLSSKMIERMLEGDLKNVPSEYLGGRTPVHAFQTLGFEWRELIKTELWSDAWKRRIIEINHTHIVNDDLRFLHERWTMREFNPIVVRIEREGRGPAAHISEREYLLIQCDMILVNDGTPEDLYREFLQQLKVIGRSL